MTETLSGTSKALPDLETAARKLAAELHRLKLELRRYTIRAIEQKPHLKLTVSAGEQLRLEAQRDDLAALFPPIGTIDGTEEKEFTKFCISYFPDRNCFV